MKMGCLVVNFSIKFIISYTIALEYILYFFLEPNGLYGHKNIVFLKNLHSLFLMLYQYEMDFCLLSLYPDNLLNFDYFYQYTYELSKRSSTWKIVTF